MEIFGVGPLEFLLVLVLALVILGPEDMVGTARKIGQWIYRVVRSPTWRSIMETSQDLRELPQKIVRDAGLEETMKEIKDTADEVKTDLNATTAELNAEMRAATNEVNREMQTAVLDANQGMKEAADQTQIAMESAAAGLMEGENTIAPPQAQAEAVVDASAAAPEGTIPADEAVEPLLETAEPAAEAEALPVLEEALPSDPYEIQLSAIAFGLGGKEARSRQAVENSIFHVVPTTPLVEKPTAASPEQLYTAGLDSFAQALGTTTQASQTAGTSLEGLEPAETAFQPWAMGIPAGLNLHGDDGMQARLNERILAMTKSLEKLDSQIKPSDEAPAAPAQAEDSAPLVVQEPENGNGHQIEEAPPTRARRKKTAPTGEAAQAETSKAAPRKRAAKAETENPDHGAEEAPKPAPRKRAAKKAPLPEASPQDSSPAQA